MASASYPTYGGSQPTLHPQPQYSTGYPYPPSANSTLVGSASGQANMAYKPGQPPPAFDRGISRTPSPTPSEQEELSRTGIVDWQSMLSWRYWVRREWIWYYVAAVPIIVIAALTYIYHTQIVDKLMPAANWMKHLHFGFLIPIGILFVISFPPLFGHEIVAIVCGLVWGTWIGFALVAAGTFVGEIGNFYAFKYCCHARGEKLERTKISYACLARIVRDGGFRIALVARFSAIPGHFTTAVFSTCGMSIWVFCLAAFLSLPKQFVTVYIGVILQQSEKGGSLSIKTRLIDYAVVGITTIMTFVAMWYIYSEMNKVKPTVIYERRKKRQAKLSADPAFTSSTNLVSFNPHSSETDIPLHPYSSYSQPYPQPPSQYQPPHQRWDNSGNAVGFAGDPRLAQPQPQPGHPYARAEPPAQYRPARQHSGSESEESDQRSRSDSETSVEMNAPPDARFARTGEPPALAHANSYDVTPHTRQSPVPFSQYAQQRAASPPQQAAQSRPSYGQSVYPPTGRTDPSQTPTQAQFASYAPQQVPSGAPSPGVPLQTPTYQQSFQPPPQPPYVQSPAAAPGAAQAWQHQAYDGAYFPPPSNMPPLGQGGHRMEESDATFYTAAGGPHSREGTDASVGPGFPGYYHASQPPSQYTPASYGHGQNWGPQ